jgi:hypothetical protein
MEAQKKAMWLRVPKEYRKMGKRSGNMLVLCVTNAFWFMSGRLVFGWILALFPLLGGRGNPVLAQSKTPDPQRVLLFWGQAGISMPSGDLAKEYGAFGDIGMGSALQTKTKWYVSLEGAYLFGNSVKNDPIPNLRTPDGTVIGVDGNDAGFKIYQRGIQLPTLRLGKTFSLKQKVNTQGGLTLIAGTGWMEHWTFIEDITRKTPQFAVQYRKGYDRRAGGLNAGLWLGYMYLPEANRLNFHAEFGYSHGFTYTYRYNFATGQPAGQARQDGLWQLRFRICFTVRSRSGNTEYYY